MRAYSEDFRLRIIRALARGEKVPAVAARYEVSVRTVYRLQALQRSCGSVSAKRHGGYRKSRLIGYEARLTAWIEAEPDLTLVEIRERLAALGVKIGNNALWHMLDKLELTYKKNAARHRAGQTGRSPEA